MGTPFAEHTHRKTGTGCVYCRLQNATERLIDTCVFVRALGHRLFASHPPTLILAAASRHSSPQCTQPRIQHQRIAAAELFTDAHTRHWFPRQFIRLGQRWTLWMPQEQTQYPSFAGARQVAGAGQGGLLIALPPPPWLAWWRSASWVRHRRTTAAPRRPTATTTGAPTERAAVRARVATMASGTMSA